MMASMFLHSASNSIFAVQILLILSQLTGILESVVTLRLASLSTMLIVAFEADLADQVGSFLGGSSQLRAQEMAVRNTLGAPTESWAVVRRKSKDWR